MAYRIAFFGTPEFAVPSLATLIDHPRIELAVVVTQPDRPAGRGRKLQESPVKSFALQRSLPVLQPSSIRRELDGFLEALAPHAPLDLAVVVAFGQLLPLQVLQFPKQGCVNVHASLLPRWRGAAPIQRAILSGDAETGVSLMRMEEGLDTGPVYAQRSCPIEDDMDCASLHDRLAALGALTLAAQICAIIEGSLQAITQDDSAATYAAKIGPQELRIDWHKDALSISRLIRAMSPAPGAYTTCSTQRLKILRASPKSPLPAAAGLLPGQVCAVDRERLEIKCGTDVLSLDEVQVEGKRRMPIGEFLRGHSISTGCTVGAAS